MQRWRCVDGHDFYTEDDELSVCPTCSTGDVVNLTTAPDVLMSGPHPFSSRRGWLARFTLGLLSRERCDLCYLPFVAHPTIGYVPARLCGDRARPELSMWSLGLLRADDA